MLFTHPPVGIEHGGRVFTVLRITRYPYFEPENYLDRVSLVKLEGVFGTY